MLPICQLADCSLLILSPALHRPGPKRQGLRSQYAHFWVIAYLLPGSPVLGIPEMAGVW